MIKPIQQGNLGFLCFAIFLFLFLSIVHSSVVWNHPISSSHISGLSEWTLESSGPVARITIDLIIFTRTPTLSSDHTIDPYINSVLFESASTVSVIYSRPVGSDGLHANGAKTLTWFFDYAVPTQAQSAFRLTILYDSQAVLPASLTYATYSSITNEGILLETHTRWCYTKTKFQSAQFATSIQRLSASTKTHRFTMTNLWPYSDPALSTMFGFELMSDSLFVLPAPDITFTTIFYEGTTSSFGTLVAKSTVYEGWGLKAYTLAAPLPDGTIAIQFDLDLESYDYLVTTSHVVMIQNDAHVYQAQVYRDVTDLVVFSHDIQNLYVPAPAQDPILWQASVTPVTSKLFFLVQTHSTKFILPRYIGADDTVRYQYLIAPQYESRNIFFWKCSPITQSQVQTFTSNRRHGFIIGTIVFAAGVQEAEIDCELILSNQAGASRSFLGDEASTTSIHGFHMQITRTLSEETDLETKISVSPPLISPSWFVLQFPAGVLISALEPLSDGSLTGRMGPLCYGWCDGDASIAWNTALTLPLWIDPSDNSVAIFKPELSSTLGVKSISCYFFRVISWDWVNEPTGYSQENLYPFMAVPIANGQGVKLTVGAQTAAQSPIVIIKVELHTTIPFLTTPFRDNQSWTLSSSATPPMITFGLKHRRMGDVYYDLFQGGLQQLPARSAPTFTLTRLDPEPSVDPSPTYINSLSGGPIKFNVAVMGTSYGHPTDSTVWTGKPQEIWNHIDPPIWLRNGILRLTWPGFDLVSLPLSTNEDNQMINILSSKTSAELESKINIPAVALQSLASFSFPNIKPSAPLTLPIKKFNPTLTLSPIATVVQEKDQHWFEYEQNAMVGDIYFWRSLLATDLPPVTIRFTFANSNTIPIIWVQNTTPEPLDLELEVVKIELSFEPNEWSNGVEIKLDTFPLLSNSWTLDRTISGISTTFPPLLQVGSSAGWTELWSTEDIGTWKRKTGLITITHAPTHPVHSPFTASLQVFPFGKSPSPTITIVNAETSVVRYNNNQDDPSFSTMASLSAHPQTIVAAGSTLTVVYPNPTGFYPTGVGVKDMKFEIISRSPSTTSYPIDTIITTATIIHDATTMDLNQALSIPITIPIGFSATKVYIRITQRSDSDQSAIVLFPTTFFTVAPSCFDLTTTPAQHSNPQSLIDTCGTNQQCGASGCTCQDGWKGTTCQESTRPCSQCPLSHLADCSVSNECVCSDGWDGVNCQISDSCIGKSEEWCGGTNGYLEFFPQTSKCSTTCTCLNNWMGPSCQLCPLECANNGRPTRKCDRCGCVAGTSGTKCECSSVIARLTINGYSHVLLGLQNLIDGGLSSSSGEYTYLALQKKMMEEELIEGFGNTMNFDLNSFTLSLTPVHLPGSSDPITLTHTTFEMVITYACSGKNSGLNKEGVGLAWDALQQKLFQLDPITTHFIFPSQTEITIIDDGIQETPATFEPKDEEEINGAAMFFLLATNLLFIFTLFLSHY